MGSQNMGRRGRAAGISAIVLMSLVLSLLASPAAAEREISWVYDRDGKALPAPVSYIYDRSIEGLYTPAGSFGSPTDLFLDHEGYLWVADTGNDRILQLTQDGDVVQAYGQAEGPAQLDSPAGVFVTVTGELWIADRGNNRVVVLDRQGQFLREFGKPTSKLLTQDKVYQPTKVVVDRRGYIYVVNASGDYRGIFQLDARGTFRGFFGANRLPFDLFYLIIRAVTTETQRKRLRTVLPVHNSNLFLDERGFVWTVAPHGEDEQIKKLSPVGANVYRRDFTFGEARTEATVSLKDRLAQQYATTYRRGYLSLNLSGSQFVDVTVSQRGVVSALDKSTGLVYQYDQLGNLLMLFGGLGTQTGKFERPVSLVGTDDGSIYVLDADRDHIQRYRPTGYAQLVHQASELFYDGYYSESAELWREVLRRNANLEFGHVGVAKAFYRQGEYQQAMAEYALARDSQGYSRAFGEYRHDFVRANFGWVMPLVILTVWLLTTLLIRGVRRIMALNLEVTEQFS